MARTKQPKATVDPKIVDNIPWKQLNQRLQELPEQDVLALLNYELKNQKRHIIAVRLHMRYNKLRCHRERNEILEKVAHG